MGAEQSQFEAKLSCEDLDIQGSGQQRYETLPAILEFVVRISEPSENNTSPDDAHHNCLFEVTSMDPSGQPYGDPVNCHLMLRSVHRRILPSCNIDRSRTYIERTEVVSKEAQVHITFKESPNDVFTVDHGCRHGNTMGHNRAATMQESRFSLPSPGQGQVAFSVGFYPDCDNDTVRELYTHRRMDDCYMEVYSLCQEGEELIQTTAVQASDEVMFCPPPKALSTKVLEQMALNLRIESKPVLVLILATFNTLLLYLFLIPMIGIRYLCTKQNCRSGTSTYQKVPKADPSCKESPALPHGNYVIHSEDECKDIHPESNPEAKQDAASSKSYSVIKALSTSYTPTPQNDPPITTDTPHTVTQPPMTATSRSTALLTFRYLEQGTRPPHGAGRLSSMPALAPPTRSGQDQPTIPTDQ